MKLIDLEPDRQKRERERGRETYITNNRNERRASFTDLMNIRKIKDHHKQLCAHKLDNLNKIHQFLRKQNLSKLMKEK